MFWKLLTIAFILIIIGYSKDRYEDQYRRGRWFDDDKNRRK